MNPAWRFHKGDVSGAEVATYNDSKWGVVSLPHGIEYLPTEASGCINYQGVVWYRKHFSLDGSLKGKKLCYQGHVQGIGWDKVCSEGQWCGTRGKKKRLEAVRIWFE